MPQALYDFINRLAGVRSDAPEMLKRESARAKRDGVLMGDASGKPDIKTVLRLMKSGKSGLKGVMRMNATPMDLPKGAPSMGDPEIAGFVDMAQKFPAKAAGELYNDLRGIPGASFLPSSAPAAGDGTVTLKQLVDGMVENVSRKGASGQLLMNPWSRAKELDALMEFMTTYAKKTK